MLRKHNKVIGKKVKRGPRPNKKPTSKYITFVGVNPAGIASKWKSWKNVVAKSGASVWFLQETKCNDINKLKMNGFIVYEKVREDKGGGGVAIAAKKELNPALIDEPESDIDAITID